MLSGMNDDDHITENLSIAETALPNSLPEEEVSLIDKTAEEFRNVILILVNGGARIVRRQNFM